MLSSCDELSQLREGGGGLHYSLDPNLSSSSMKLLLLLLLPPPRELGGDLDAALGSGERKKGRRRSVRKWACRKEKKEGCGNKSNFFFFFGERG